MADYHGQRARELIAARKVEDSFSTMDRVMSHLKKKTHDSRQTMLKVRPVINSINIQTALKAIEGPDSGEQ